MPSIRSEENFFKEIFNNCYEAHVCLQQKSYIKIGGVVRHVIKLETENHLELFEKKIIPRFAYYIVGKASNTLISCKGLPSLVVMPAWNRHNSNIKIIKNAIVELPAGMPLARAVRSTQQAGFFGLEFALGIPGSVGGAICMNAGADGSDISNVLHSALVFRNGSFNWVNAKSLNLSYRACNIKPFEIVAAGRFLLKKMQMKSEKKKITAACLASLQKRKKTQPLGVPSLGSTFKNPKGNYAAKLIEESNLKGFKVGGICVSTLHANFIVNSGSGTAQQAYNLIELVREKVKSRTGITLQPEVRTMGSFT